MMLWFYLMHKIEKLHPLEGGIFRLKYRTDRRAGMPIEHPLIFYPKYAIEIARKATLYARTILRANRAYRTVMREDNLKTYTDIAITPADASEFDELEMFHATQGGDMAVAKSRDQDKRRERYASAAAGS